MSSDLVAGAQMVEHCFFFYIFLAVHIVCKRFNIVFINLAALLLFNIWMQTFYSIFECEHLNGAACARNQWLRLDHVLQCNNQNEHVVGYTLFASGCFFVCCTANPWENDAANGSKNSAFYELDYLWTTAWAWERLKRTMGKTINRNME